MRRIFFGLLDFLKPYCITASKKDDDKGAVLEATVVDHAGNSAKGDPVFTTLKILDGQSSTTQTYTRLPKAESHITLENGEPGLTHLLFDVNGIKFNVGELHDNAIITLDVSSAMVDGNHNTITVLAQGNPGATAFLIISDVAPQDSAHQRGITRQRSHRVFRW